MSDGDRAHGAAAQAIARAVRGLRAEADLTQQEVADASGLSVITIHRIEAAKRLPDTAQLVSLGDAFGVTAAEIMRRAGI